MGGVNLCGSESNELMKSTMEIGLLLKMVRHVLQRCNNGQTKHLREIIYHERHIGRVKAIVGLEKRKVFQNLGARSWGGSR